MVGMVDYCVDWCWGVGFFVCVLVVGVVGGDVVVGCCQCDYLCVVVVYGLDFIWSY